MRDLHLFHFALNLPNRTSLDTENVALLKDRVLPRLDFGPNLVQSILLGTKTITMRLLSGIEGDTNSDLDSIFPYSIVTATTTDSADDSPSRAQFAYLQIDKIETHELGAMNEFTFVSRDSIPLKMCCVY